MGKWWREGGMSIWFDECFILNDPWELDLTNPSIKRHLMVAIFFKIIQPRRNTISLIMTESVWISKTDFKQKKMQLQTTILKKIH